MKLSTFKQHLDQMSELNFLQPNGAPVPPHFHITEAGLVSKHFLDCGGTVRTEKAVSLQIWASVDTDHRLAPGKLLKIISQSEKMFGGEDMEVEVEYQTDTVGKYGVDFQGDSFVLQAKHTDCLAKSTCGIPAPQTLPTEINASCCTPGGGCC
jgi:Family of unknown function (DUF6428)